MHIAPLLRGHAAVWWAHVDDMRPQHIELLNTAERRRLSDYRRDIDRRRFSVGVALSRAVLGSHLGLRPGEVPLDRTCPSCGRPHGRPRVDVRDGLELSVSHAGDLVAVAFVSAPATGVGVDVEPAGAAPEELESYIFSAAERSSVIRLTPDDRAVVRLRAWVRKEAVLKATGDGLRVSMSDLTAAVYGGTVGSVEWAERADADRITVRDLSWPGPAYAASLAVRDAPARNLAVAEWYAGDLLAELAVRGSQ